MELSTGGRRMRYSLQDRDLFLHACRLVFESTPLRKQGESPRSSMIPRDCRGEESVCERRFVTAFANSFRLLC